MNHDLSHSEVDTTASGLVSKSELRRLEVQAPGLVASLNQRIKDLEDENKMLADICKTVEGLENKLITQTNKAENEERIRINYVDRTIELEAKLAETKQWGDQLANKIELMNTMKRDVDEKLKVAIEALKVIASQGFISKRLEKEDYIELLDSHTDLTREALKKISEGV